MHAGPPATGRYRLPAKLERLVGIFSCTGLGRNRDCLYSIAGIHRLETLLDHPSRDPRRAPRGAHSVAAMEAAERSAAPPATVMNGVSTSQNSRRVDGEECIAKQIKRLQDNTSVTKMQVG